MQQQWKAEDLPVGFMMRMANDSCAMRHFFAMPCEKQQDMLDHIRNANTGQQARSRMEEYMAFLEGPQSFSQ